MTPFEMAQVILAIIESGVVVAFLSALWIDVKRGRRSSK